MSLSPLIYWATAFLVVSLLGLYASNKFVKIDLDKNGDLIVAMLTILGLLVSVLLGLLVSSADGQYSSLEASVNSESTYINEISRLSRGLPIAIASKIQDDCIQYCEEVISDEWPSMRKGETSELVTKTYAHLSDEIVSFHPANNGENNVQSAIISASSQLGQARGLRLVASRSTWTHRMLPLMIACAIVVLTCSYLYAGKSTPLLHSFLVGLVAITLGTNIGVIFLMTRPFTSEWTIKPEGFELHLKVMKQYKSSLAPAATPAVAVPTK